jgi:hypothetical protein
MSSKLTQEYLNEEEWWLEEGYANPEDVPVPDWHLAVLEERMAQYGVHFPDGTPWEELEKELMQKIVAEIEKRKK